MQQSVALSVLQKLPHCNKIVLRNATKFSEPNQTQALNWSPVIEATTISETPPRKRRTRSSSRPKQPTPKRVNKKMAKTPADYSHLRAAHKRGQLKNMSQFEQTLPVDASELIEIVTDEKGRKLRRFVRTPTIHKELREAAVEKARQAFFKEQTSPRYRGKMSPALRKNLQLDAHLLPHLEALNGFTTFVRQFYRHLPLGDDNQKALLVEEPVMKFLKHEDNTIASIMALQPPLTVVSLRMAMDEMSDLFDSLPESQMCALLASCLSHLAVSNSGYERYNSVLVGSNMTFGSICKRQNRKRRRESML